ncbi:flagellar hook-basal body protein FliE [Pseudomonas alcaligenes]|uniref:Flagellar hook-basal body complex protein FliE n=1 Tax=Aquipseudomonas alcaligenes TaxID=43263 RepID=A0ABR7RZC9_AQUAC|nr:flagellar hook-basal body complex protein FliE [Pseudomonas alcaligenes]MBC9249827.1 flagellar hook-basal body protein FliE [Pseudomonas alcaligenes]
MTAISQIQQGLLGQLEQFSHIAEGAAISPAQLQGSPAAATGIADSFEQALRAVDADQQQAGAAMAAVDSGKSEDLVGAMIDSQKASLSFTALLQVRNKLAGAFDDIMRMPL